MAFDRLASGPIRIDLACGQVPRQGFEGADLFAPNVQHRLDVLRFPWRPIKPDGSLGEPWADGSVEELHCSHFAEHIPMGFIDADNNVHVAPGLGRKDMFFAFFDECWRVLRPSVPADPATGRPFTPGGKMTVIVPYLQHQRAFQDPTHRRFLCEASFLYLVKDWRDQNGLSHYGVNASFDVVINKMTDVLEGARHPEAQATRAAHYWNVVTDLLVTMTRNG